MKNIRIQISQRKNFSSYDKEKHFRFFQININDYENMFLSELQPGRPARPSGNMKFKSELICLHYIEVE